MTAEREVLGIVKKAVTDQIKSWEAEKASLDKRIAAMQQLQAESDRYAELIAEARKKESETAVSVEAIRRREGR